MSIIEKLKSALPNEEPHVKNSFWATETETPAFDIYHKWIGTEPTNPPSPEKLLMFSAAKMIEQAIVDRLVKSGHVQVLESQQRIDFEHKGFRITGYADAIEMNGDPIEVKTYYGYEQDKQIKSRQPKASYLKQLAIYIYALNRQRGTLLYMERGYGDLHEFELLRTGDTTFKCESIEFDLADVFERWSNIYYGYIEQEKEPPLEFKYKIPVREIDWSKESKSDVMKARNNQRVVGNWQATYSPYLELWLAKEGTQRGYTLEEIQYIKSATAGYSTK